MRPLIGFLLLTFCLSLSPVYAADLRVAMVALDRALIPVLVLTAENRPELAAKAARVARNAWYSFKEEYYLFKTADSDWRKDFDKLDALYGEAFTIIAGRRQIALAIAPLDRASDILQNLRRRNNIDHYFDLVQGMREPLNTMIAAADSGTPPDQTVTRIRGSYASASSAWATLRNAAPGRAYRLSAYEMETLQRRIAGEATALNALAVAVDGNDYAAIIAATLATRDPFASIYNFFGDFHALVWDSGSEPAP